MNQLQSMTGFSSASTSIDAFQVSCEMRSVNGKSLDLRLRLPSGFEAVETAAKKLISDKVKRGNIQVSISLERGNQTSTTRIDHDSFKELSKVASELAKECGLAAPTADAILALRGVVVADDASGHASLDEAQRDKMSVGVLAVVEEATNALIHMRELEGAALALMLNSQLQMIESLVSDARKDEASQPEAIFARLSEQLKNILDGKDDLALDPERLHAEVALLVTKSDICEEIDRLSAHVKAARDLLEQGGAVGRKLDFLAQEFNRETNTICSKSSSVTLTATGLALKAVIDQFKEQVQNLQ